LKNAVTPRRVGWYLPEYCLGEGQGAGEQEEFVNTSRFFKTISYTYVAKKMQKQMTFKVR
jgi:hypothetical protein